MNIRSRPHGPVSLPHLQPASQACREGLSENICSEAASASAFGQSYSRAHLSRYAAGGRRARSTFQRCLAFIEEHLVEIDHIESLAAACHVNVHYLCRLFRQFSTHTPLGYLRDRKMCWAAERLRSSSMMVREVAEILNMDPFQFSRSFKRVHGLSPSHYLQTREAKASAFDVSAAPSLAGRFKVEDRGHLASA